MMNENFRDTTSFLANTKPHGFARQLSGTTSCNDVTWTTLVWDFEDVDTDSSFTGATFSYYNVNTTGFYVVTGHVNWNNTSTANSRAARLAWSIGAGAINAIPAAFECTPATAVATGLSVMTMKHFNVNDRIYLQGFQNSGGALSTNLNYTNFRNETSFLDVAWWGKTQ